VLVSPPLEREVMSSPFPMHYDPMGPAMRKHGARPGTRVLLGQQATMRRTTAPKSVNRSHRVSPSLGFVPLGHE
jgi:hypothetical protein